MYQCIRYRRDFSHFRSTSATFTIVKKRKMQFFGNTNKADYLATIIMPGSENGKRGRGRSRATWLRNIVAWTGLVINVSTSKLTLWIVKSGKRRLMLWLMAPPRPRWSRDRRRRGMSMSPYLLLSLNFMKCIN